MTTSCRTRRLIYKFNHNIFIVKYIAIYDNYIKKNSFTHHLIIVASANNLINEIKHQLANGPLISFLASLIKTCIFHTSLQVGRRIIVCSNWAVYEPFISHNGGYCSTSPTSTRFFSARKYFVSPRRSRYRRQKGSVPKFLFILPSKALAFARLRSKWNKGHINVSGQANVQAIHDFEWLP